MVSEKAMRPGDILTASNGKTIEVYILLVGSERGHPRKTGRDEITPSHSTVGLLVTATITVLDSQPNKYHAPMRSTRRTTSDVTPNGINVLGPTEQDEKRI